MLIQKFKYKLITRLQDRFNSGVQLLILISALVEYCLSNYKQTKATDRMRNRNKS